MAEQIFGGLPLFQRGVQALIPLNSVRNYTQWVYLFLKEAESFEGGARPRLYLPGGLLENRRIPPIEGLACLVRSQTGLEVVPHDTRELASQIIARADDVPISRITYFVDVRNQGLVTLPEGRTVSYTFLPREVALEENLDPCLREVLSRDGLFSHESYSPSEYQNEIAAKMILAEAAAHRTN